MICPSLGRWISMFISSSVKQSRRFRYRRSVFSAITIRQSGDFSKYRTISPKFDISPDGTLLAVPVVEIAKGLPVHHILLINLNAGQEPQRRVLNTDPRISRDARFTPDAKAIVYPIRDKGVDNLWLQPVDGSRGHQITNFSSDTINHVEFSHDGKILGVFRSHSESDVVLIRDISVSGP